MRRGPLFALAISAAGCSMQLSGLGSDEGSLDVGVTPDTTPGGGDAGVDSSASPDFGAIFDATDDDTSVGDSGGTGSDGSSDGTPTDTYVAPDARPDVVVADTITLDAITECKPGDDELLVNGSFEKPSIAKDTRTNSSDPNFLPGWKLKASDSGKFWLENGKPSGKTRTKEGAQSICLNGDGSGTSAVEQSFSTVVGASYQLSLWFTDESVAGPTDTSIKVEVGSEVFDFDRKSDTGFVQRTIVFRAFDTSTVVRITDTSPSSMWLESPFIDLVSVHRCD